jgi:uncharacterized protein YfaS (alpha-2-macroglobulin family)
MKGKISLLVAVCLLLISSATAQNKLQLNEAEIKAVFDSNRLQIDFAAVNAGQKYPVKIRLEILDAADAVLAKSETIEMLERGRQTLKIPLDFAQIYNADDLPKYRLRYLIAQENSSNSVGGIVSLSEIMPEIYELQITAAENVYAGMKLRAHVLAVHPLTKKPIKNVNIAGEVALDLEAETDIDELKIKAYGKTNDEGFVSLDFEIPNGAKLDDDGDIKISGVKNGIRREAEADLDVSAESRVYLTLDKPIYQPNQKLYVRGLYLNPSRRPFAERDLTIEILDEEGETVDEQTVKTSRFGVASLEWQIPESVKLGKYKIEVKNGDDDEIGASEFKITRYDLPNFTVSANADKTFYLPGQNTAEINVRADYLFGKPLTKGKVRVMRETARKWNYQEQKWDTEESNPVEGETGAEGKFTARIDLIAAQKDLQYDSWKRFEDLHFAAYYTDATTNRTEIKRFDVRLSKEAIHIYFIGYASDVNPQLPFGFYVSTFYADGSPARCDIEIKGDYRETTDGKSLTGTKTNSYGAGKIELRIPEKPYPEAGDRYYVQIFARDRNGSAGTFADSIYLNENAKQIRLKTDKTVYLPNEAIETQINSTETNQTVSIDVISNSSVVYSERMTIKDGRETFRIPFRPEFKGELTIAAYFVNEDGYKEVVSFSKTIIYPSPNDLKLSIKSLKDVYRPNEEAKISFNARNSKGGAETALGVVVLDKAIEERARTEQMADNYTDLRRLIGTADSFGNFTRRDLNNLDLSKPIEADLQLAAEFLLIYKNYTPRYFESDSYAGDFREIYKNYFTDKLQSVETTLKSNYEKTGEFPSDEKSLRRILTASGINFDELRDAWETPYQAEFRSDRNYTTLVLKTASADKKFGTADDFTAKEMRYEWFAQTQNFLTTALNNYIQQAKQTPQTTDELKAAWKQSGIDFNDLRDNLKRPLYLNSIKYNRTTEKFFYESIGNLDGENQQIARTKTVSQEVILFKARSVGADGVEGGYDDFDLGAFTVVFSEKDINGELPPSAQISKSKTMSSSGAITGTLFDPTGAVIPGVKVTAENQSSEESFSVYSDQSGVFWLTNLPSGKYRISAESPGFQKSVVENVVVSSMNSIKLDFSLYVAGMTAEVSVTAGNSQIVNTTSSSVSVTKKYVAKSISGILNNSKNGQNSTPRVREYFPETLLWQPEIITDKKGGATLNFKLADSLTTWKLYAVGSTETGEVALVEKEMRTFQPFFAELDPPKILTEGDEIALPVPVRNYTDKRRKVSVSMAENSWSNLLGGTNRQIEIEPNDSQNAIFNFRAASPVKDGKQKVTALAKGAGDAIEKSVTVNPNGKETVQIQSQLYRENAVFNVNFPVNSFANTRQAKLKIYPNLLAHVAESVEGLLKRPYGCGEQTTSSTYPNLLILKIEKELGKTVDATTKTQAKIYLQQGYERLLNYQTAGGGFSYWGKSDTPNAALTAYVLRFLNDAKDYITVDEKVVAAAQNWLLKQQANGNWQTNQVETDASTAYIARSLALDAEKSTETKKSLRDGLEFLKKRLPEIKDAYVLANYALAAIESGDLETAQIIADKLILLSQIERETLYWETANTPFHGWGLTAKIETTALVTQVLARLNEAGKYDTPLARGLAFTLKNKDKYGVWYSTQTTVNVLDALILLQKKTDGAEQIGDDKAEIIINGKKVQELALDAASLAGPIGFDASPYLNETSNHIEIKNVGSAKFTQAQIVTTFYNAWKDAAQEESRYFDLSVNFDRTEAKIGDEINCSVVIARKNYSRYGMLLAEIGIPPGADVDRNSLEKLKNEAGISRYDVLPDRVIVYFWAQTDGTKFSFKFKPRYGINAQSAPSIVYDYYNPEAQATVAPLKFIVK